MKREKKEYRKIKKQERRENINLFIQINKQTDRQAADRRTDRHKSFTGMRYNTEQYSKSNSIKEKKIEQNQIKSNQFEIKQNRIEQNRMEIKSAEEIKYKNMRYDMI